MTNIYQFPKAAAEVRPTTHEPTEAVDGQALQQPPARHPLAIVWAIARVPLFLVLYWLRFPLMLVCRFLSAPVLLVFLFTLYAFPDKTHMHWALGGASFLGFAGLWLYDLLLMALSPQEMMRTL
ncbi:hypothetical protein ACVNIS_24900 (plasmid) [Sphaerotilaceae bacterium SBD11-9]